MNESKKLFKLMQIGYLSCRCALNFTMKCLAFLFDLGKIEVIFAFALSHLKNSGVMEN